MVSTRRGEDCPMSHSQLLRLKRWNMPAIYNSSRQITKHEAGRAEKPVGESENQRTER